MGWGKREREKKKEQIIVEMKKRTNYDIVEILNILIKYYANNLSYICQSTRKPK